LRRLPANTVSLLAVLGAALVPVGLAPPGAAAAAAPVKATLTGSCTTTNLLNGNGVLTRTTETCDASGACSCPAGTQLTYHVVTMSPGTGVKGHEKGSLRASGPAGSAIISLVGSRTADGTSNGSWALGSHSGFAGSHLRTRGGYETTTKSLARNSAGLTAPVRISATIACWNCSAGP
jgi:hypothetical protein